MPKLTWEFTSDDQKVQAAFDKLNARLNQLEEKAAKAGRRQKRQIDEQEEGHNRIVAAIQRQIGTQLSAEAAINLIRNAWQSVRDMIREAGDASREALSDLNEAVVQAGLLQPGTREKLERAASTAGVTTQQVGEVFRGITGAAPELSQEQMFNLTAQVGRLGGTGADLRTVGRIAGRLELAGVEGAADQAAVISQALGDRATQFAGPEIQRGVQAMIEAGAPPRQAIALGIAALRGNLSSEALNQIAEKYRGGDLKEKLGGIVAQLPQRIRAANLGERMTEAEQLLAGAGGGIERIRATFEGEQPGLAAEQEAIAKLERTRLETADASIQVQAAGAESKARAQAAFNRGDLVGATALRLNPLGGSTAASVGAAVGLDPQTTASAADTLQGIGPQIVNTVFYPIIGTLREGNELLRKLSDNSSKPTVSTSPGDGR